MSTKDYRAWNRRRFLRGLSIAGGAALLALQAKPAAAEPPPEITTIRLIFDADIPVLCYAPQYIAEEFLRIEGFTEVRYVPFAHPELSEVTTLARNQADFTAALGANLAVAVDRGSPVTVLAGLHAGCFEIFANDSTQSIREIKGKRVAILAEGSDDHLFIASVAAYIGIDPDHDIEWVTPNPNDWTAMLAAGEVDVISAFPPMSYAIHASKIGHVILNTTTDEPWRHYFCCMVAAQREFAQNYPVATKRALRAMLKANQLCSLEPQRMARILVERGYESNYDYALHTLQDVRYGAWRDYDPEDALRFFSLRLREAGMIKQTPQEIITRGTDWRFFNELRVELKA